MGKLQSVIDDSRICCVDPNDMHGQINHQPMTPDYTDYCIWCNLVVETVSRVKNQAGGTDNTGTYSIQYDMTNAGKHEYVSFLQGKDAERYNYLTTDYTEIDFKSVKSRNMVEGLQIESIRVSLQNFQCPMVTIKFVDVRGGGFFGREEATHNEYGQLTGLEQNSDGTIRDNIFSCFTTMPYPRFKLQIKGFYGSPVTYQLTCSSFQGSFNSATGNFDITTQFVGYEYGVLGDIPFSYIVAAPYTRTGSVYWNKHVNSAAWSLASETVDESGKVVNTSYEPPVKLVEFYNNIEAAINEYKDEGKDINDVVNDYTEEQVLESYAARKTHLEELKVMIDKFKNMLISQFGSQGVVEAVGGDCDMVVIFSETEEVTVQQELLKMRNDIGDKIENYIAKYSASDDAIDSYMVPNCGDNGNWTEWANTTIKFGKYISYSPNGGTQTQSSGGENPNVIDTDSTNNGKNIRIDREDACEGSKIVMFASDKKLSVPSLLSQKLFESLGTPTTQSTTNRLSRLEWSTDGSTNYRCFATVIDFGDSTRKINETLVNMSVELKKFEENKGSYKSISEMVGFAPYIGNYFKVVMCHLETFIDMFFQTAKIIYDNEKNRTPHKLGIRNLKIESDVPGQSFKWVPPFPATYKNYESQDEFNRVVNTGRNILETSWVGDFKGETEWAEQKFVEEMAEALLMVWDKSLSSATKREETKKAVSYSTSYNPIDYIASFPPYALNDIDSMAFYTALRAYLMFGVVDDSEFDENDNTCELLGIVDGYNYAAACSDGDFLGSLLGNGEGSTLNDEIIDIVTCKDNGGGERHVFEFSDVSNGRHPVFKENGEKMEYVYMKTTDGGPIIPIGEYTDLSCKEFRDTYTWNRSCFHIKNPEDQSFVFGDSGENFVSHEIIQYAGFPSTDALNEYTNKCMFEIVSEADKVESIEKSAEKFSKLQNVAQTSRDLLKKLDERYTLGEKNLELYRSCNEIAAYKETYEDCGIDESMLVTGNTVPSTITECITPSKTNAFIKNFTKKLKI